MRRPGTLKESDGSPRLRHKPSDKPLVIPADDKTSNDAAWQENYTRSGSSPGQSDDVAGDEATLAAEIVEGTVQEQEPYARTYASLLDKYVLSPSAKSAKEMPFVVLILIIGFIFIQDNEAGRLENWRGLLWTIPKCSFCLILYFAYLFWQWLRSNKRT